MQKVSTADRTGTKIRNKVTYVPKPLPDDPLANIRLPTVLEQSGMSRTSLLNGIKMGEIPPGRLLSPRCRVFNVGEIKEWLKMVKDGCTKEEIRAWVKTLNRGRAA